VKFHGERDILPPIPGSYESRATYGREHRVK
jgi:hypothetical protein